ncbi:phosphonate ABC transporter, permease protein PhnE [Aerococcaceae bacterium DSM 111021]|nr:phosphonate ABC transporter, permease protein PhnE [Aerococcaceae bacterium DSM 111021]
MFKPKEITLSNGKSVYQKATRVPLIILLLLIFTFIALRVTETELSVLAERGEQFFVILGQMIPPNWKYSSNIWRPMIDTIQMSLLGSVLGAIVAIPIAMLSSANLIQSRWVTGIFKLFLSITRTLPTLITASIATFVFGIGTTAGTIAIFIFTFSYIGKLMYENIENIDMGPFEAMESMGLSKVEAFRYAVVPQIMPTYLSVSLFAFEGNIRYAAILGYVGAGGIGLILNQELGWRDYANAGMILLILMVVVFIIEQISEYYRQRLT